MKKLTQEEANELIRLAWSDVERYSLGMHRFGSTLYNLHMYKSGLSLLSLGDPNVYRYEQNCDIAIEKFFKFFVEVENE